MRKKKALFFFFFLGKYYLKSDGLKEPWDRDQESSTLRAWSFPYHTYKKLWCNKMAHLTKALKTIS